jgi:uncharacterized repeat protein (TIGR01451 family)
MQKKLLFLAFILLMAFKGYSQAQAYPAPDINQCGNEVFDLTVQTPIILGNQNPLNFSIAYYLTQADAVNNTNPVTNPTAFVSPVQQLIFAKVINILDSSSAITTFYTKWNLFDPAPFTMPVFACESYELPLLGGNYSYYSGPIGTGTLIDPEFPLTETQTVYIYVTSEFGCVSESSFLVTIHQIPVFNTPDPVYGCINEDNMAFFNLTQAVPQILGDITGYTCTFHNTQAAAFNGVNAIATPQEYYAFASTVFASIIPTGTTANCRSIIPVQLIPIVCNGNAISGYVSFNFDGDCDTFEVAAEGIPVYLTQDNDVHIFYANANGYYHFDNIPDGSYTVHINAIESNLVSPSSYTVTTSGNITEQNFCITPQGEATNDVSVVLFPINQARPGFPASYAVIYQNPGTVTQSGQITLQFDGNNLVFSNATPAMVQSGNTLTLNYTNLYPFQSKTAMVNFTVNVPQITPIDTVLNFTANITGLTGDINVANNTSVVSQTVINSYDPNDIAVREGEFITEAQADDYLNYTVRFQNKGTANAENVRVVVALDENLDWSTFEALSASHDFTVKRTGDEIEFLFNGIDLAFEAEGTAVPESNGYFIYRIKPKANVTVDDSMSAQADIYFDFNDPITTNEVTTTVQSVAGLGENNVDSFTVYPNPASGNVNLTVLAADNGFDVTVIDILGKTVLKNSYSTNEASLNIASLNSGVYFVSITANGKNQVKKLIVK